MKLSKAQVEAIVNTIATKQNEEFKQQFKLQIEAYKKQITPVAKKYLDELNSLSKPLKEVIARKWNWEKGIKIEDVIYELQRKAKMEQKFCDRQELENKIMLASINSKDLEELKKVLNITF